MATAARAVDVEVDHLPAEEAEEDVDLDVGWHQGCQVRTLPRQVVSIDHRRLGTFHHLRGPLRGAIRLHYVRWGTRSLYVAAVPLTIQDTGRHRS